MEVLLLGTGSADGWPNPFCSCASCAAASDDVRGQTAALVDNTVLLDCGPEVPRAVLRTGRSLRAVRHILITHDHADHLGPAALLWRQWAHRDEPIDVVGPESVIAEYRHWVGPTDPVRFHSVQPGDRLTLGSYDVRVLAARHETETVLYDLTGADGTRLLYATDTGPLPTATLDAASGRAYDLVLLEETFGDHIDHGTGHLDLRTFPEVLRQLRARGATQDQTDVVAIHLSHHNPSPSELARRLSSWGARMVPDGTVISLPARDPVTVGMASPRRALVLGGARSGKSAEAERRLAAAAEAVYVATGGARPDDLEWQARIAEHRARRPPGWHTVETTDLEPLLGQPGPPLLIDCLALWLTAVLDEHEAWDEAAWAAGGEKQVRERTEALTDALRRTTRHVVLVSNEVGAGVVPATPAGRRFRDELGRLNLRIASVCDEVLLVVAGRVLPLPPTPLEEL